MCSGYHDNFKYFIIMIALKYRIFYIQENDCLQKSYISYKYICICFYSILNIVRNTISRICLGFNWQLNVKYNVLAFYTSLQGISERISI